MWEKIRNWFRKTKNGKEGEPRKALRVPSYRGRLIGKWLFWGILAWMFFVSCTTVFKSYTTATQKELEYVLENPEIRGLEGSMKLDKVISSKVYPGKTKETYEVQAEVLLIDVHSETKMKAAYTLVVKQTGKQFVVTDLKN